MPTTTINYIPAGLAPIVPQLVIKGANKAIQFYQNAFGAELLHSMPGPNNTVMHSMVKVGEATFFITDATDFAKATASNTFLYVKDVDAVFKRAIAAGATVLSPLTNMFWGDRWALLADPYGNQWQIATHIEDVSPEEMQRRMMSAGKPS